MYTLPLPSSCSSSAFFGPRPFFLAVTVRKQTCEGKQKREATVDVPFTSGSHYLFQIHNVFVFQSPQNFHFSNGSNWKLMEVE
jgi:hypothetical protein